jgi:purine-nucleoside phosphorylase
MPTPHNTAKKGDYAKVVLMPGDPKRAKWIAEKFLKDPKLVNEVRGALAYTGLTENGKRISVMGSGMGMPSIGIYSHELYAEYGVEAIIRVGTCGGYQDDIDVGDVLLATSASTDSSWALQYGVPMISAAPDFELAMSAYSALKASGMKIHAGPILSEDAFYNADPEKWKRWAKLGMLGVEMESYALYVTALTMKKRALTLLTVSDCFTKKGELTPQEREQGLGKMIGIAIKAAEPFCD